MVRRCRQSLVGDPLERWLTLEQLQGANSATLAGSFSNTPAGANK
jgi:hypothetical protein